MLDEKLDWYIDNLLFNIARVLEFEIIYGQCKNAIIKVGDDYNTINIHYIVTAYGEEPKKNIRSITIDDVNVISNDVDKTDESYFVWGHFEYTSFKDIIVRKERYFSAEISSEFMDINHRYKDLFYEDILKYTKWIQYGDQYKYQYKKENKTDIYSNNLFFKSFPSQTKHIGD